MLERTLHHANGQIDGKVYEYGSFLQSGMYHGPRVNWVHHESEAIAHSFRMPPASISNRSPIA